jgi:NitT/TauT family transport system substrate-binding protein
VAAATLLTGLAACGDDSSTTGTTNGAVTTTSAATVAASGVTAAGISAERCAANKAAGHIVYLTGFDYAASASIVDVIVAKQKGYFDKMCLDVEIKSSFSLSNYPLVASNTAQFASGGSYAELLENSTNGAKLQAVEILGRNAIEALLVPAKSGVTKLADLKGKNIGVKGDLPPSIVAMLNRAGLVRGSDYKETQLKGFDPKSHVDTGIDALPVYKSNEPNQLTAAGGDYAKFTLFDPAADGTPGSFGVIFTSTKFAQDHPSAVQDFARADLKGFADADADPAGAVAASVALINAAGNKNYLSEAGESFRWKVESKIVTDSVPAGALLGVIDRSALQAQVDAYTAAKVFAAAPSIEGSYDDLTAGVYGADGKLVWPS